MILTVSSPGRPTELIVLRSGAVLPSLAAFHLNAGAPDTEVAAIDPALTANVPEPDTLALVGATVAAIAIVTLIRRKRRK